MKEGIFWSNAIIRHPLEATGKKIADEHVLGEIEKERFKNKTAKNCTKKFEQLKEEWTKIRLQTLTNLIESMQRRCEAVLKAKGMATKY
uniref:Uncharacterized protein n=1 Tax=Caenorhabditis japonica TaxID=281687 RepID=A0A8R1ICY3_CAEJA